jgi:hypothetical protein
MTSYPTFLNRAVDNNTSDPLIFTQTEDFFVDPDPMIPITYWNFDHFSPTAFAAIPVLVHSCLLGFISTQLRFLTSDVYVMRNVPTVRVITFKRIVSPSLIRGAP